MMRMNDGTVVGPDNPAPMKITDVGVIIPSDVQSHLSQAVNAIPSQSVAATSSVLQASWQFTNNAETVSVTVSCDASITNYAILQWSHDGVNYHGEEQVLSNAASAGRAISIDIKADYVKLKIGHTDAAAHTMSGWLRFRA